MNKHSPKKSCVNSRVCSQSTLIYDYFQGKGKVGYRKCRGKSSGKARWSNDNHNDNDNNNYNDNDNENSDDNDKTIFKSNGN